MITSLQVQALGHSGGLPLDLQPQLGSNNLEPSVNPFRLPQVALCPGGATLLPAHPEAANIRSSVGSSSSSSRARWPGAGVLRARMGCQLWSHPGATGRGLHRAPPHPRDPGWLEPRVHCAQPASPQGSVPGSWSGFQFRVHRLQGAMEVSVDKRSPQHSRVLSVA